MKIDWQTARPDGKGHIQVDVDNIEDFWTLATVLRPGDCVKGQIRRKIKNARAGTGKSDPTTTIMVAKVRITEIDFQPGVEEMQLRGVLVHDIEGGKAGTFQRMMLGVGRPFTLSKTVWDSYTIELLREASDPVANATVAAVLMANGVANVCVIGRNATRIVDHIQRAIPKIRKMGDGDKSQVARGKFFEQVAQSLVTNVSIADLNCVILASPGFLARDFHKFLTENQHKLQITAEFQAGKFIVAPSSGAHLDALEQVLLLPEVSEHVQELKAVSQARAWTEFQKEMNRDVHVVSLGPVHVMEDLRNGAVRTLLATDTHVMSLEFADRMEFIRLRDQLTEDGFEAIMFSSTHTTGQQLNAMSGGIAAILKYPVVRDAGQGAFDEGFDVPGFSPAPPS